MKKLLNVLGVLLALAAVGFGFVSCDNDVSGVSGGRAITAFTAEQNGEAITFKWKVRGVSDNDIRYFRIYCNGDNWQQVGYGELEKDGAWFVYSATPGRFGIETSGQYEARSYGDSYAGGLWDATTNGYAKCTFDYTAPASVE